MTEGRRQAAFAELDPETVIVFREARELPPAPLVGSTRIPTRSVVAGKRAEAQRLSARRSISRPT